MIEKQEVLIKAKKIGLEPSTLEKDYVLRWVLRGIYQRPDIQKSWILKEELPSRNAILKIIDFLKIR